MGSNLNFRPATKEDLPAIINESRYAADKKKGCVLIQLTSDKRRPDAIRFYKSLGFIDSHEGMKLKINYLNS